jgi:hypothetical protein
MGPDDSAGVAIYVGEADELRSRLNMHHASLDFWTRAITFVSKDENLNKAGVKYLESKLVALAADAKRATLRNGNTPGTPYLSEADEADAAGFLEEMLPVYPLLGLTAFEVVVAVGLVQDSPRLVLSGPRAQAAGRDTSEGFVVESGSAARPSETASLPSFVRTIRAQMLAGGILVPDGDRLRLTRDWVFSSPSTAAMTFLGRPANGRTEWSDELGRTLKAIQEESAA